MFNTFKISFKLRNAYKVNSIIYSLKQIPLIKKILPNRLYQSPGLKLFANIISFFFEIQTIFLGKILYILLMIIAPLSLYNGNKGNIIMHLFIFLSIAGAFLNTYMFNPTKDKYYAIFTMHMNAKIYTLTNYFYSLLKAFIGFLPCIIVIGFYYKINILFCLLIPFFIISIKMIVSTSSLYRFQKRNIITNENLPDKLVWTIIGICLFLGYSLPYFNIIINPIIVLIITIITITIGIFTFKYIINYQDYRIIYKHLLSNKTINIKKQSQDIIRDKNLKLIDTNINETSHKKGFEYFNEIFIKRHKKILFKSANKTALILLFILFGIIAITFINNDIKKELNKSLLLYLPYLVFIMYTINKTQVICQGMFMNCDHSLLTYSFYKDPVLILKLFRIRLLSIIKINLIPTSIIALGLPILLLITGGTNNILNYFIIFISIISLSIFFSIHHLVIYYLLQPYNINFESKSSTYGIANFLTYIVCYCMLNVKISTLIFGLIAIIFCILYCLISLFLVYKLAPKTFKLRT